MRAADKESSAGQSHWPFTAPQCFINGVIKDLVMSYLVRATRQIIYKRSLATFHKNVGTRIPSVRSFICCAHHTDRR